MASETTMATCQVCGRGIKANTGIIAHHGYKRPGFGWQTASCMGARYVPYEVSCERLKEVVEIVKEWKQNTQKTLDGLLTNPPQTLTVSVRRSSWSYPEEVTYEKPENFSTNTGYSARIPRTYENAYATKKSELESAIKDAQHDIKIMEQRIQQWKPV